MTLKANMAVILATLLAGGACRRTCGQHHFHRRPLPHAGWEEAQAVEGPRLVLSDTSVQVQAIRGSELFKELERGDIKAATYSKSKHPRWKSGVGFAVAIGIFALPIFFMKAKHHWLTLQGRGTTSRHSV